MVIEIDKPTDEQRERWMRLAVASQEVNNLAWQFWLAWHVNNRSRMKLTAFMPTWKQWQETKEGDKPTWPVENLSAELQKQIRQFVNAEVPDLHSRAKELQLTMTFDKIKNLKSLKGNKGGWISVVMGRQRPDQSINPLLCLRSKSGISQSEPEIPGIFFATAWRVGLLDGPTAKRATD